MALQIEEFSERAAQKETLIDTEYLGTKTELLGTKGKAYLKLVDNQWIYIPDGTEDEYRVLGKNLSCNNENGWISCKYLGVNPKPKKTGKAFFSEEDGCWLYKPQGGGKDDLYRVKNDTSLEFARDKDVI